MSLVWLNGDLLQAEEAKISVLDRGFTLGDGLFETMRAYGGRIFRLHEHLLRLERSAGRIGLPLPSGLAEAVRETVSANGISEAAVRLTVSRGSAPPGLEPPESVEPTCVITARPAPEPPASVRAGIASGRLNEHAMTAGLKLLGYLNFIVALREARSAGYDDALLLDTAGHLAEGAASNLFVVAGGVLRTPPLDCGVLPGITRAAVLEIGTRLDRPVSEESLEPAILDTAEEAFMTSTLREVVPLVALDGRAVGKGVPGPITRRIQEVYAALARSHE